MNSTPNDPAMPSDPQARTDEYLVSEEPAGRGPGEDMDPARLQMVMARMKEEENFTTGVVAGLVAGLAGAVIWAVVTVVSGYQIGWMAIGIGFLVGFAVRKFGRGMTTQFGVAGAVLALLGCLVGNVFSISGFIANEAGISPLAVLAQLDLPLMVELMTETFSPMDLLFYGLATYEGYKLSFREVTEEDLVERYETVG